MMQKIKEIIMYEGYTYDEVCKYAGGGKSGKVAAEAPKAFQSITGIGVESGAPKTMEDTSTKENTIATKRMGTRGLQIPLASTASTTATPANTGVQV
jgi:hypothetical protein